MATPIRRIVDSSPLILLARIGQLDLLRAGAREIIVPDTVFSEVGVPGPADPVFQEIQRMSWLTVVRAPLTAPQVMAWGLGAGESAVLTIALTDPHCEAILDDRDARRCAFALNIRVRGTVGLVILAKQVGSIPSARPVVERLRQAGLFLTDEVASGALALVGE